jgi:hypothetical protein
MSRDIKETPKKPREVPAWTPIPELARWERAMEQLFGETSKKKPAGEMKKPLGDSSKTGDSGPA